MYVSSEMIWKLLCETYMHQVSTELIRIQDPWLWMCLNPFDSFLSIENNPCRYIMRFICYNISGVFDSNLKVELDYGD